MSLFNFLKSPSAINGMDKGMILAMALKDIAAGFNGRPSNLLRDIAFKSFTDKKRKKTLDAGWWRPLE